MSANMTVASSMLERPRPIPGCLRRSRANGRGASISTTRRARANRAEKAESSAIGVAMSNGTATGIQSRARPKAATAVAP